MDRALLTHDPFPVGLGIFCLNSLHGVRLAAAVLLHVGNDNFHDIIRAWVEGYRSVRPLSDDHLKYFPTLLMARGLVALGWVHTRRETELAQLMTDIAIEMVCQMAETYLEDETKLGIV